LAYERLSPLPKTVTPLKPETGKGYVIKTDEASENQNWILRRKKVDGAAQ
jgi:hypothetical protein